MRFSHLLWIGTATEAGHLEIEDEAVEAVLVVTAALGVAVPAATVRGDRVVRALAHVVHELLLVAGHVVDAIERGHAAPALGPLSDRCGRAGFRVAARGVVRFPVGIGGVPHPVLARVY